MMIKKTLTILAVSCMMYSCANQTESTVFTALALHDQFAPPTILLSTLAFIVFRKIKWF